MKADNKRYLGIDWGTVRIGLAIGDSETKMASPWGVVKDMEAVLDVIRREEVDEIVLGVPYQINDTRFSISKLFEEFKEELTKSSPIPLHLADERLSSRGADALAGDKKTKAARDAVAAMLILQSFMDRNL